MTALNAPLHRGPDCAACLCGARTPDCGTCALAHDGARRAGQTRARVAVACWLSALGAAAVILGALRTIG